MEQLKEIAEEQQAKEAADDHPTIEGECGGEVEGTRALPHGKVDGGKHQGCRRRTRPQGSRRWRFTKWSSCRLLKSGTKEKTVGL